MPRFQWCLPAATSSASIDSNLVANHVGRFVATACALKQAGHEFLLCITQAVGGHGSAEWLSCSQFNDLQLVDPHDF